MRYKIHTAYVSGNGSLVPAGTYDAEEINLIEARQRSIVTREDATVKITKTELPNAMPVTVIGEPPDVLDLTPEVIQTDVELVDINHINKTDLIALKYIGRKTAETVLEERDIRSFSGYGDLNKRAPLPRQRKWEDAHAIDFAVDDVLDNSALGVDVIEM
jgi:DNA uptake protein ComE-like DNA-binding protein